MAGRHRLAAQAEADKLDRALRFAFGGMVQGLPGLDVKVTTVSVDAVSLAEVPDMLEPAMFVALLEGQSDRIAASLICPALLAGVVEAIATGRVSAPAPVAPRPPTRTDAALTAPLIDDLLHQISSRCAPDLSEALQGGWVYGSFLSDPRPLPLMLEEGPFLRIRFNVNFGPTAQKGTWSILLPDTVSQTLRTPVQASEPNWAEEIEATIHACPTEFSVTLFRAQVSLDAALDLAVGDVLCIPVNALEVMTLETLTGSTIATGRLGQARGQKAIRLATELGQNDPEALIIPKARSLTPILKAAGKSVDDAPRSLSDARR
jgi:flagellar motor switch protein FliM